MPSYKKANMSCCFTGHRPNKLACSEDDARRLLSAAIEKAVEDGYSTFITGMAEGVDIWAAMEVLKIRSENPDVRLLCAPPYPTFGNHRALDEQIIYDFILDRADAVHTVSQAYSRRCYQIRNEWMVDRSMRVIALYNGEPGGTRNTIKYAEEKGVEVINLLDKNK